MNASHPTLKATRWLALCFLSSFVALLLLIGCGPASTGDREPSAIGVNASNPGIFEDGELDFSQQSEPSPEPTAPEREVVATAPPEIDDRTAEYDASGIEVGFTSDGHAYRGDPSAPVVVEEFSDYQCPYCARFVGETLPVLSENQVSNGDILLVFYDFPLSSIHPQAEAAANAARCAGEQGALAYWQMHDLLFEGGQEWHHPGATDVFAEYAERLDLDLASFNNCVSENRYAEQIQADYQYGQSRGVSSTPSFFLNNQPLVGAQPLAVFNQAISAVLAGDQIASQPSQAPPSQPSVKPTPAAIALADGAGQMGDEDAPVIIVEYTDYQCPYCQRHSDETMPQIVRTLIETGRVFYMLKDFPLDSIHASARTAAVAARCAGEQGSYWEMHDAIFAAQATWSAQATAAADALAEIARDLGLEMEPFQACASSGRYDDAVQANLDEGISLGVRGTPFFFINGFPINGAQPYELFEYAVGLAEEGTLADAYVGPEEEQQAPPPEPTGPVDVSTEGSPAIGDPDAPVVVVEYTDYQCPYCSRHFRETLPLIKENFIDTGLVRYVFKDLPLTTIHPQAFAAAEAARCAGEQEAYLAMHDMLFDSQTQWSNRNDATTIFAGYARDLGIDAAAFDACMASHRYQDAVNADLEEAVEYGIRGTPAFFLNGNYLSGAQPFSVFEQAINSLLSQ